MEHVHSQVFHEHRRHPCTLLYGRASFCPIEQNGSLPHPPKVLLKTQASDEIFSVLKASRQKTNLAHISLPLAQQCTPCIFLCIYSACFEIFSFKAFPPYICPIQYVLTACFQGLFGLPFWTIYFPFLWGIDLI